MPGKGRRALQVPEARAMGRCEPPNVGAGNRLSGKAANVLNHDPSL